METMFLILTIYVKVNFRKSGKKTPGLGWYWSGCAGTTKRGLEILGFAMEWYDHMHAKDEYGNI